MGDPDLSEERYMTGRSLPETIAYLRITSLSWQEGMLCGEVQAASYQWYFCWFFRQDTLQVTPSLGRALIYEALGRFLEHNDYHLEAGGDYEFVLRSRL
jgi:hypothetical protein